MPKLTNVMASGPTAPIPVAPVVSTNALPAPMTLQTAVAPKPFSIAAPNMARSMKAGKKASATVKSTALRGTAWFQENVAIGDASIVVQTQKFAGKRGGSNGFHCPPCGIAGNNAIVIRALPGKGTPINIYEVNTRTGETAVKEVINGFMVGATCLKKYGKIDILNLGKPMNPQPPPQQLDFSAPVAEAPLPAALVETPSVESPAAEVVPEPTKS